MKRSEATAFIKSLVKLRTSATDDQAIEAPAVYPTWKEDVNYVSDTRVLYNGTLYRVLSDHTSQADWTPDATSSLFAKVLTSDDGKILPWEQPDSTNPYKVGDKVSHNGSNWISVVDNNVWEPGIYGWEIID